MRQILRRPGELGPDLREMSRKLTREGIASILFSPKATYPDSKMPRFFFMTKGRPRIKTLTSPQ